MQRLQVLAPNGRVICDYDLTTEHLTIGRARDNTLRLADISISVRHARIIPVAEGSLIEDLGSTNGTFVNAKRISKHVLGDADEITFRRCDIKCIYQVLSEATTARTQLVSLVQQRFDPWGVSRKRTHGRSLKNRRGENGFVPFRTGRFYNVNGQWYCSTREGDDLGPYESKEAAQAALAEYLRRNLRVSKDSKASTDVA